MSGRIIPLHGDLHDDTSALLPWYATGRLDPDDTARVEAHLATCTQCQADLVLERRLAAAVADLPADDIGDVDDAFNAIKDKLTPREPFLKRNAERVGRDWGQSASWLRWAIAAQLVLLIGGGALLLRPQPQAQAQAKVYHTLSAAPAPAAANIVVVFRPEVTEADLRQTLRGVDARVVDGPTVADAYLLHVEPGARATTVAKLRGDKTITLAEPIDGDRADGDRTVGDHTVGGRP